MSTDQQPLQVRLANTILGILKWSSYFIAYGAIALWIASWSSSNGLPYLFSLGLLVLLGWIYSVLHD